MTRLILLLAQFAFATVTGHAKRNLVRDLPHPELMSDDMLAAEVSALLEADERSRRRWACRVPDCDGLPHKGWLHRHARHSQRVPKWFWTTWLMMTGRGWGKTRTAAEAVRRWARKPDLFIAVIAKNETLVREICFESKKSGLLAVFPPELVASYSRSQGNVHMVLTNGTIIRGFGGEVPDNLRGWAFDKAWADEYAAWNRHTAQATLDMVWFCLREAEEPQVVISTTPKPLPHVVKVVRAHQDEAKRIAELEAAGQLSPDDGPTTVLTIGPTSENRANLSGVALRELENSYGSTRLGQQELGGELLEDVEGALWSRWMFETDGFRLENVRLPGLDRVVVAVDVATTTTETADESGLAVMGRGPWRDITYKDRRPRGYLLHTEVGKTTPWQTMARAAALYHAHQADAVILEANNGGEYLSTVLMMVDPTVNFRIVNATRDKRARATPVAGLYEQERMHHVGSAKKFDRIETLMTTYVGAPEKDEKSPDELDAVVWAATDLFLDPNAPGAQTGPPEDERLKGRR